MNATIPEAGFLLVLTGVLALLSGCGGPREPVGLPVDTVAVGPELTFDAEPVAVIGGAEKEDRPGHALYLVRDGLLLGSGRVVVATEGSQSLLYYGLDGTFLGEVGRRGGGPGEFEKLRSVHPLGADSVAAWDPAPDRITVFDSAGNTVATHAIDVDNETPSRFYPRDLHGIGATGFVLIHQQVGSRRFAQKLRRQRHYLTFIDRSSGKQTTVGPVPGTQIYDGLAVPFGDLFNAAAGDSALYIGYERGAYVIEYALDGTATRRLRLPIERRAISASERASIRERFGAGVPEANRAGTMEIWDEATEAAPVDSFPAYIDLASAGDGSLWVQLGAPDARRRWLVIDPIRRVARPITMFRYMRLLDADVAAGRVLLQVWDEAGREIVQVHRVE